MDRFKIDLTSHIHTRGPPPGFISKHVQPPCEDQPMRISNNRRPAPVTYDENIFSANFGNMRIVSNTNNNATELNMRPNHSLSHDDLCAKYSSFPKLDSKFMHNNNAVSPVSVQSNFPRLNECTHNNDKTEYNIWALARNSKPGPLGGSFFSDENERLNDLIESLKINSKPPDQSGYKFSVSDFPPLPLLHNTNFIDSRSSLSTKSTKQNGNTSNADTAINESGEMTLLDELLNETKFDKDFKKIPIDGSKNATNGLGRKSSKTLQDQFGMLGIVSYLRSLQDGNTDLLTLTKGYDILTLHQHANIHDNINPTNNGAFAERPLALHHDDTNVPSEYIIQHKIKHKLAPINLDLYNDDTLFYIFYQFSGEMMQIMAAGKLRERQWRFFKGFGHWVRYAPENKSVETCSTHERAVYIIFDETVWARFREEMVLPLNLFEQPEDYQYK